MKTSTIDSKKTGYIPVFQIAIRKRGAKRSAANPTPEPQKRENTFSKSRDTREDRGTRQMKTARKSRTFPHAR